MLAVFGKDQLVAEYIIGGTGDHISPPYVCIGFTRDERSLCAGVLFNNWTGSNIDVSLYGPGALNRNLIAVSCRYAFRQIRANRVSAKTRRSNKTMQRLFPRIGFIFEGTQKRYYGPRKEDDALLYALFPDAAEKWMK